MFGLFAPGYYIVSSDFCPRSPCHDDSDTCVAGMTFDNTYRKLRSGTSQSTALVVSGAIALLLEKYPKMTLLEVKGQ